MSIGDELKNAREEKGLSIDDVMSATRISKKYIHALEDENFLLIPSQVFTKGFLKTYSDYIGLDTKRLTAELVNYYKSKESAKKREAPPVSTRSFKFPKLAVSSVYTVVLVLLLIFIIYEYRPQTQKQQITEIEKPAEKIETPVKPVNKNLVQIKVEAVERAWVLVLVNGKQIYSGTLEPGAVQSFSGSAVTVKTGNGGGIKIYRDGKLLGLMGEPAKVSEQSYRAVQ